MLSKSNLAILVPIKNMNRALKFYTKILGGSVNMRAQGEMKNDWASVRIGKAEFWLIRPEVHEKRDLAYSTFIVKNIAETVKGLKKRGVRFLPAEKMGPDSRIDGPISYSQYGAGAFLKDSEGNLLMLWQSPRM